MRVQLAWQAARLETDPAHSPGSQRGKPVADDGC